MSGHQSTPQRPPGTLGQVNVLGRYLAVHFPFVPVYSRDMSRGMARVVVKLGKGAAVGIDEQKRCMVDNGSGGVVDVKCNNEVHLFYAYARSSVVFEVAAAA